MPSTTLFNHFEPSPMDVSQPGQTTSRRVPRSRKRPAPPEDDERSPKRARVGEEGAAAARAAVWGDPDGIAGLAAVAPKGTRSPFFAPPPPKPEPAKVPYPVFGNGKSDILRVIRWLCCKYNITEGVGESGYPLHAVAAHDGSEDLYTKTAAEMVPINDAMLRVAQTVARPPEVARAALPDGFGVFPYDTDCEYLVAHADLINMLGIVSGGNMRTSVTGHAPLTWIPVVRTDKGHKMLVPRTASAFVSSLRKRIKDGLERARGTTEGRVIVTCVAESNAPYTKSFTVRSRTRAVYPTLVDVRDDLRQRHMDPANGPCVPNMATIEDFTLSPGVRQWSGVLGPAWELFDAISTLVEDSVDPVTGRPSIVTPADRLALYNSAGAKLRSRQYLVAGPPRDMMGTRGAFVESAFVQAMCTAEVGIGDLLVYFGWCPATVAWTKRMDHAGHGDHPTVKRVKALIGYDGYDAAPFAVGALKNGRVVRGVIRDFVPFFVAEFDGITATMKTLMETLARHGVYTVLNAVGRMPEDASWPVALAELHAVAPPAQVQRPGELVDDYLRRNAVMVESGDSDVFVIAGIATAFGNSSYQTFTRRPRTSAKSLLQFIDGTATLVAFHRAVWPSLDMRTAERMRDIGGAMLAITLIYAMRGPCDHVSKKDPVSLRSLVRLFEYLEDRQRPSNGNVLASVVPRLPCGAPAHLDVFGFLAIMAILEGNTPRIRAERAAKAKARKKARARLRREAKLRGEQLARAPPHQAEFIPDFEMAARLIQARRDAAVPWYIETHARVVDTLPYPIRSYFEYIEGYLAKKLGVPILYYINEVAAAMEVLVGLALNAEGILGPRAVRGMTVVSATGYPVGAKDVDPLNANAPTADTMDRAPGDAAFSVWDTLLQARE